MSEAVDQFLSGIDRVRARGDRWIGRCPAHEDREASLSIAEGDDGKLLLTCFAGCSYVDIMAARGMSQADGFNDNNVSSGESLGDPTEVYDYTDENGKLLFQVCRFAGKRFRQRQPDGTWGMKEARRVLYRLPEVLERAKERMWLFVCEGEKDVEAIRSLGGVATCNPMGAGKWLPEYAESLRGACVRIVVDKDDPGKQHAERVAKSLRGVVSELELKEAARGKDAADHIAAGFGLEDFRPFEPSLITRSGYPRLDLSQGVPDVDWVIEDFLVAGEVTVAAGDAGIGKSFISKALALAVAGTEESFLGLSVRKHGRVLYVDEENTKDMILQRLNALGMEDHHRRNLDYIAYAGVDLAREPERLKGDADELKPALIVLDSLSRVLLGVDENSNTEMSLHFRRSLIPLARDTGAAVLVIHHTTGSGKPRGASAIKAAADQVIAFVAGDDGAINIYPSKPRRRTAKVSAVIEGNMDEGWIRIKRPGPSWA